MKTVVVIPAYNEEQTIGKVVQDLKQYCDEVIVVNDGSDDETAELAERAGADVVCHCLNCGLGAALKTGFAAALKNGAEIIITFDADGQHQASDIPKLVAPLRGGECDVVIGVRQGREMPISRRIANYFGNIATFLLFGIWTCDSQSGLRAFSRRAAEQMDLRTNRMEVSSEIFQEIKEKGLNFQEVAAQVVYNNYSLSKGQSFTTGLKTLWRLILHKIC